MKINCTDAVFSGFGRIADKVPKSSVDLAIVFPPPQNLKPRGTEQISRADSRKFLKKIMADVHAVTRPGGICCLILGGDLSAESDALQTADISILKSLEKKWNYRKEIIWVKSAKGPALSVSSFKEIESVSLDQIPFSHICVLEKRGSKFEFIDTDERLSSLKISNSRKSEIGDSIWYVQPKSEKGYSDRIPKEIATRLILLYSKKGGLVLDVFAGNGSTAVAAKILGRKYVIFADGVKTVHKIKTRLNSV